MAIRVLDAAVVGRIAAGEVVERPASVVKELMENSIDAGATSITVEMRGGGIDYLRVTDNGCGIEPGQVRLAFENHATSKLQRAEQLDDIRTLGFRGEALPSVAAVAKVEMTTRAKDQESGMKYSVEGGQNPVLRETGCPQGTTIVVKDLFFNVPVRRAFLKKPSYEGGLVSDVVSRLLLGNPNVSVRFVSGGSTLFHSFGDGKLRHAVFAVYGRETAEQMVEIDASEGGTRIRGLIGVGELSKSTRAHQLFFINGRSVRCPMLSKALEEVCRTRVTIGMVPMCVLNLTLPPTAVDVNVHPNKLEVRFRDGEMMRTVCEKLLATAFAGERVLDVEKLAAARPALERRTQIREIPLPNPDGSKQGNAPTVGKPNAQKRENVSMVEKPNTPKRESTAATEKPRAPKPEQEKMDFRSTNVLREAVLADLEARPVKVIDCAGEKPTLRVVGSGERAAAPKPSDAAKKISEAAEKIKPEPAVVFAPESTQKRIETAAASTPKMPEESTEPKAIPVQERMETVPAASAKPDIPFRVIGVAFRTYILVEAGEQLLLIDQHAAHERLNYERFLARAEAGTASQQLLTPVVLRLTAKEAAVIEDNLDTLEAAGYTVEPFGDREIRVTAVPFVLGKAELRPIFLDMIESLSKLKSATLDARRGEIMQMACKRAVKAGDPLPPSEIESLIAQMLETGAPPTCPHGRPVVKTLSKRDLEKMFKRIQ